jgi:hypothetical protein
MTQPMILAEELSEALSGGLLHQTAKTRRATVVRPPLVMSYDSHRAGALPYAERGMRQTR